MYTINATTGALASIGTIAAGTDPVSVVVDPSGKFAYVANSNSNDVSMYTINATTGALASIGTIAAGTAPVSVAVDPSGKFAYVTNFSSNDVSMYSIDGTTGALTPIGTIAAGQSPTSIAVHPSGKFAYVTNSGSDDVSMYSIDGCHRCLDAHRDDRHRDLLDCGGGGVEFDGGAGGELFAADVAHSDCDAGGGRECGAGDESYFGFACAEFCAGRGRLRCGKLQRDALAVHVAARAHALDDFLSCVAAFVEADVRVFQSGFVGNHGVVEVGREPGDAGFEAQGVECSHADWFTAVGTR